MLFSPKGQNGSKVETTNLRSGKRNKQNFWRSLGIFYKIPMLNIQMMNFSFLDFD